MPEKYFIPLKRSKKSKFGALENICQFRQNVAQLI